MRWPPQKNPKNAWYYRLPNRTNLSLGDNEEVASLLVFLIKLSLWKP